MRSSKSRSRSKSNRNRSVGNVVNRVFDSSGPEGKVRGTPQQIIDKYNQLARDAQLGNDRVAFENFQQHAEHYTRMLAEAQREQDQRREQDQQNRERQQSRQDDGQGQDGDRGRDDRQQINGHDGGDHRRDDRPAREEASAGDDDKRRENRDQADVIDTDGEGDSTLVETPESRPPKPRRRRRTQPDSDDSGGDGSQQKNNGKAEAAE